MKTLLFLISAYSLTLFFSCSKPNNNNTPQGYWILGGLRHNINYTTRKDSNGLALLAGKETAESPSQPTVNSINIWFTSFPVKDGSYKMIPFDSITTTLADYQIGISGIIVNDPNTCPGIGLFDATGINSMVSWPWSKSANAEVNVSNRKIRVVIPLTTTFYVNPCGLDSFLLTGIYQER
jgi:hypothetical protein